SDGNVRVSGTRVTLDTIIGFYQQGFGAEELADDFPTVPLADIHATLSYYFRHKAEVDAYLEEQDRKAAEMRHKWEARFGTQDGLKERLLARLAERERARSLSGSPPTRTSTAESTPAS